MSALKKILTSIHGKRLGLSADKNLVIEGFTAVKENDGGAAFGKQGTPGTLDATGALTAALLETGIVTSSTAAAVVATLDTGTAMDTALASLLAIGEYIEWTAINTGAANAFTVTAAADHTIVGSGVVALSTSATFRTKRTAANTYVTYRK